MHTLFYSAMLLILGQVFLYLPEAAGAKLDSGGVAIAGLGMMTVVSWLAAMSSWTARPTSAGDCIAQMSGISLYVLALLVNWSYLIGLPEQLPEHLVAYTLAIVALLVIFAPTALLYAGPIRPHAKGIGIRSTGLMSVAFFALIIFFALAPAVESFDTLITDWTAASRWPILGYLPPLAVFGSLFALIALVFGYRQRNRVDSTIQ